MKNIHSKKFLETHMSKETFAKLLEVQFHGWFEENISVNSIQSMNYCVSINELDFDIESNVFILGGTMKFLVKIENEGDDLLGYDWVDNARDFTYEVSKNEFKDCGGLVCLYLRILETNNLVKKSHGVLQEEDKPYLQNAVGMIMDIGINSKDDLSQKMIPLMYQFFDKIHSVGFLKEMFSKEHAAIFLKEELKLELSIEEILERIQSIEYKQKFCNVPVDVIIRGNFDDVDEHLFVFDNCPDTVFAYEAMLDAESKAYELYVQVDHEINLYYIRKSERAKEVNLEFTGSVTDGTGKSEPTCVKTRYIDLLPYNPNEPVEPGTVNYMRYLFKDLLEVNE